MEKPGNHRISMSTGNSDGGRPKILAILDILLRLLSPGERGLCPKSINAERRPEKKKTQSAPHRQRFYIFGFTQLFILF
ncbi:MAG: hypothetical protein Q4B26_12615, partial [Eubacteriales bacterium]|nr:hypothetical protein [Eubacteriales bacterium]